MILVGRGRGGGWVEDGDVQIGFSIIKYQLDKWFITVHLFLEVWKFLSKTFHGLTHV